MTDRELLEKAAKAAGMHVLCIDGAMRDCTGSHPSMNVYVAKFWNPLTDDGDALRLFCSMPWLAIETSDLAATVRERGNPDEPSRVYLMWTEWLDKHKGDLSAATRRAIVRAAASMAERTA